MNHTNFKIDDEGSLQSAHVWHYIAVNVHEKSLPGDIEFPLQCWQNTFAAGDKCVSLLSE